MHAGIGGAIGKNVIGVLPGRDPELRNEIVIVGAHYDHLGPGGFGALDPDSTGKVHNGADDNASGASALIHIATKLAAMPPARTVVFIAFSGEEAGLLGSDYYVKNPVFPLARTYAMVNLDMVGRLRNDRLMVYGSATATEFPALLDSLNLAPRFDLKPRATAGAAATSRPSTPRESRSCTCSPTCTRTTTAPPTTGTRSTPTGWRKVADFTTSIVRALADRRTPLTFVNVPAAGTGAPVVRPRATAPISAPCRTWRGRSGRGAAHRRARGQPGGAGGAQGDDIIVQIGDMAVPDLQAMTDALRSAQGRGRGGGALPPRRHRTAGHASPSAPGAADGLRRSTPRPSSAGLRGLFCRDAGRQELLQYAADRIQAAGPPYTSVYLYMLQGEELVLEAWSGRETEHTRIAVGQGVCGTAVATGQDQNVGDVRAVANYIACKPSPAPNWWCSSGAGKTDPGPDRRGQRCPRSLHAQRPRSAAVRRRGGRRSAALLRSRAETQLQLHRHDNPATSTASDALRAPHRRGPCRGGPARGPGRASRLSAARLRRARARQDADLLRPARRRTFAGGAGRAGRMAGAGRRPRSAASRRGASSADTGGVLLGRAAGDALRHRASATGRAAGAGLAGPGVAGGAGRVRATISPHATPLPHCRQARQDLRESGLRERDPAAHAARLFELAVAGYFHDPARARVTHAIPGHRTHPGGGVGAWATSICAPSSGSSLFLPLVLHGDDDPIPGERP